jgi:hypothetical protein
MVVLGMGYKQKMEKALLHAAGPIELSQDVAVLSNQPCSADQHLHQVCIVI